MFADLAAKFPSGACLSDPHKPEAQDLTFKEFFDQAQALAAGLAACGLGRGDMVGHFADNSSRWLLADQAIMSAGAANAVRGASAPLPELVTITRHSGAVGLVLQDNSLWSRLLPELAEAGLLRRLRFVVLLWDDADGNGAAISEELPVLSYKEVLARGVDAAARGSPALPSLWPSSGDVATLVFTSGTTKAPKAAALTHANVLYQVAMLPHFLEMAPGEEALSVLPPWHIYERSVAYYVLSRGGKLRYSSLSHIKADLAVACPAYLVAVPLLLDALHTRVRAALLKLPVVRRTLAQALLGLAVVHVRARRRVQGIAVEQVAAPPGWLAQARARLLLLLTVVPNILAQVLVLSKIRESLGVQKAIISGGSSLGPHLDDFFEALGLPVLNGWGLTETSPVLACRRLGAAGDLASNVRGTVGTVIPGTRIRVVDPHDMDRELPPGVPGLLLAQGPGTMEQYWHDPASTADAFHGGWFNTGDLGYLVPPAPWHRMGGQIVLTGRAKDTIVLSGGDNVSPAPLEDALCRSALIRHAVLLGSGHRTLGCLVVPDKEGLAFHLEAQDDPRSPSDLTAAELDGIMLSEVTRLNRGRPEREAWESITVVKALRQPFSIEGGTLTQTMKVRRDAVMAQFADDVDAVLARLR